MIKHGETDCLENTQRKIAPQDMQRAVLYTTLSPCYMCAGTILLNRIPRVVIGENKTFEQSEKFLREHAVEIVVLDDAECIRMMLDFIRNNLKLWGEDIGLTPEQVSKKYGKLWEGLQPGLSTD